MRVRAAPTRTHRARTPRRGSLRSYDTTVYRLPAHVLLHTPRLRGCRLRLHTVALVGYGSATTLPVAHGWLHVYCCALRIYTTRLPLVYLRFTPAVYARWLPFTHTRLPGCYVLVLVTHTFTVRFPTTPWLHVLRYTHAVTVYILHTRARSLVTLLHRVHAPTLRYRLLPAACRYTAITTLFLTYRGSGSAVPVYHIHTHLVAITVTFCGWFACHRILLDCLLLPAVRWFWFPTCLATHVAVLYALPFAVRTRLRCLLPRFCGLVLHTFSHCHRIHAFTCVLRARLVMDTALFGLVTVTHTRFARRTAIPLRTVLRAFMHTPATRWLPATALPTPAFAVAFYCSLLVTACRTTPAFTPFTTWLRYILVLPLPTRYTVATLPLRLRTRTRLVRFTRFVATTFAALHVRLRWFVAPHLHTRSATSARIAVTCGSADYRAHSLLRLRFGCGLPHAGFTPATVGFTGYSSLPFATLVTLRLRTPPAVTVVTRFAGLRARSQLRFCRLPYVWFTLPVVHTPVAFVGSGWFWVTLVAVRYAVTFNTPFYHVWFGYGYRLRLRFRLQVAVTAVTTTAPAVAVWFCIYYLHAVTTPVVYRAAPRLPPPAFTVTHTRLFCSLRFPSRRSTGYTVHIHVTTAVLHFGLHRIWFGWFTVYPVTRFLPPPLPHGSVTRFPGSHPFRSPAGCPSHLRLPLPTLRTVHYHGWVTHCGLLVLALHLPLPATLRGYIPTRFALHLHTTVGYRGSRYVHGWFLRGYATRSRIHAVLLPRFPHLYGCWITFWITFTVRLRRSPHYRLRYRTVHRLDCSYVSFGLRSRYICRCVWVGLDYVWLRLHITAVTRRCPFTQFRWVRLYGYRCYCYLYYGLLYHLTVAVPRMVTFYLPRLRFTTFTVAVPRVPHDHTCAFTLPACLRTLPPVV